MNGEQYRSVFAKKLSYYMDLNNKTQADIAKELGYTRSAISTWCLGTRIPRPEVIDSLAQYFGIKRSDLLEFQKEGEDNARPISKDGQRILEAYNNNSKLKILFDKQLELTDKDAQMLIDIVERMTSSH